jgi:peptide/nickel transport system permease protein
VIAQEAPISFELGFLGLLIAVVVGVTVGVLSAIHRSRAGTDVIIRVPFLVIYATPVFVSGTLLILASAHYFPSFYSVIYVPIGQSLTGNLKVMTLPALIVGLTEAGLLAQMSRGAMLEVLSQPHIVTAQACGLRPLRLYGLYALKAAALPILSLIGFLYGLLIGGVIVVEQVFSLPGMGRGLLQSITDREFGELQAQVLIIALAFIVGNLLVDLISPVFDRRLVSA